ncbi:hypothetical protein [Janibacter sp. DB-40]|uniref:hypothetical protein n=1 Tax=Janibacter sp. DB-40 TaxID=3028808 RepID=UPI0024069874|nr:hypothetical protein [Janibacter sp. DB-40]
MAQEWSDVSTALAHGEWARALTLLDAATGPEGQVALELRAQAAYGAGDLEGCVGAWERLYAVRLECADPAGAAAAAASAALFLLIDTGLMAPVRGWVARAGRALEGVDEPTGAGAMMAAVLTYERFLSGDVDAAARHARVAVAVGSELGLSLPVAFGRLAQARLTILDGEVEQGLALLDEVGSTLMSGELEDLASGMLMCEVICAAQGVGDHERAREWTVVMDEWRGERGFGTIHGRCRLHKAELLRQSGPGSAAEAEALAACAELRPWMRREFGWPLTELGTIRLRRGDVSGAMEAFDAAEHHGWAPQPGAALLALACGDADAAAREIAAALAEPAHVPSKEQPPSASCGWLPCWRRRRRSPRCAGTPRRRLPHPGTSPRRPDGSRAPAARRPSRSPRPGSSSPRDTLAGHGNGRGTRPSSSTGSRRPSSPAARGASWDRRSHSSATRTAQRGRGPRRPRASRDSGPRTGHAR